MQLSSPAVVSESDTPTHSAKPAKGDDSSFDKHRKLYGYFLCISSTSLSFLKWLIFYFIHSNKMFVCLPCRPSSARELRSTASSRSDADGYVCVTFFRIFFL